jgi:hypothetical protein
VTFAAAFSFFDIAFDGNGEAAAAAASAIISAGAAVEAPVATFAAFAGEGGCKRGG